MTRSLLIISALTALLAGIIMAGSGRYSPGDIVATVLIVFVGPFASLCLIGWLTDPKKGPLARFARRLGGEL